MSGWTTLVDAKELAAALGREDLVIFDARAGLGDPMAAERDYALAHSPGAQFASLEHDLSGIHHPGAGRHPWPDAASFSSWLQRCGVRPTDQVVVYDAAAGALAAARLWFLLRAAGHRRVAVLDGGWQHWQALGLPVTDQVEARTPSRYPVMFDPSRLLDAERVQSHLQGGGVLVDARAAERFRGETEPLDRVAGHIPGACNRPFAENLRDGRFRPAAELRSAFDALLGGRPASRLAVSCGSGVTACHHLLAMEHAGLEGAALYTGSWSGWIEDPSRPIAHGD